jgi:hypothetical protein
VFSLVYRWTVYRHVCDVLAGFDCIQSMLALVYSH